MKKYLYSMLAMATMLFAASCTQEDDFNANVEGTDVEATFTIDLPAEMGTRAIGDGTTVDVVACAVYDEDSVELEDLRINDLALSGKKATYKVRLAKGQKYRVAFFAYNQAAGAYNIADLKNIIVLDSQLSNREDRDAFTAYVDITAAESMNPINKTIYLKRPFAQLNLGSLFEDIEAARKSGIVVTDTKITVTNVYTAFSAFNNEVVGGTSTRVFDHNDQPSEDLKANNSTYDYLALNYLLVGDLNSTKSLHKVTFEWVAASGKVNYPVTEWDNVPMQRNYRTNIIGYLLTNPAEFNIIVDEQFEEPDYNEPWVGDVKEPAYDAATKTYTVMTAEELAWVAQQTNGSFEVTRAAATTTFQGQTIKLGADIDLYNYPWTPIGTTANNFKGTFDGNGKTIKNLNVDLTVDNGTDGSNAGLFGVTSDGEIKNLTVENATVKGRLNVGVVAGTPYTSKYTDITVKGLVKVEGMSYVGGVGGKNAYANWTNITVDVEADSYVKANSVEDGKAYRTYLGGVCGFNGEGGHKFENIKSNINVEGTTCDVGGLFGIAHYNNVFVNCSSSGKVEITAAADAADAEEIGGIAGVWHNQNGTKVTFDGCEFTGTLKTNITNGVDLSNNDIVGAPYIKKNATGKLFIDGEEIPTGANPATLNELVKEAGATVYVAAGTYPALAGIADGVTIIAEEGTVVQGLSKVAGNNVTIKNIEFTNPNGSYCVDQTLNNTTFENCYFNDTEGIRWCYAKGDVVFTDCTFGKDSGVRGVHFDGGDGTVTFNGCDLYGFQAIGGSVALATFKDCDFFEASGNDVVNMYGKYEFNGCRFASGMYADCATDGVEAAFNSCSFVDGRDIAMLVRYDKEPANSTVSFDGNTGIIAVGNADGLRKALAREEINTIVLNQRWFIGEAFYNNVSPKIIRSVRSDMKATIEGRFVANKDVKFENVKFIPSAESVKELPKGTYGSKVNGTYASIVVVNLAAAEFYGCEFAELNETYAANAITYFNEADGKVLKIDNCSFSGKDKAIYSKVLCEVTNCQFNLTEGSVPLYVWPRYTGNGVCTFTGNNTVNKAYCRVGLLTQSGSYANMVFNVQGNTGEYTYSYAWTNSVRCATDGSVTFAEGSKTFPIKADGSLGN